MKRKMRRTALESLEGRRLLSVSLADDVVVTPNVTMTPSATVTTPQGYTPAQIKHAYGFDAISLGNGIQGDGTGQTIAIVDAFNDPNIASDLSTFSSTFGLPQANLSVVSQTGSKTALPKTDAGWAGEIALDVEWAHAIAPGAKILLVEANSDSLANLLSAIDYARNAPGVSVVSMSWGTSEFFGETSYDSHFTTPAGHQGVTFVAASGDEGSFYGPEWPASSTNVMSVGGTTLNLDSSGNVVSQGAWSDSTGGASMLEAAKGYQYAVTGSYGRTSPDVSYDADPNTGFAVYDSVPYQGYSGWQTVGGTSAGAPQWAALVAIADQGRSINGQTSLDGASGTLPTLYSLYNTSAITDVTDTQTILVRTGGFGFGRRGRGGWTTQTVTTGQGYDTTTGLGTPEANQVVSALAGTTTASAATARKTTTTRVRSSRRARWWEAELAAASTSTQSLPQAASLTTTTAAADLPVREIPQVGSIAPVAHVGDIATSLPKVTFVLAPVAGAPGATVADVNAAAMDSGAGGPGASFSTAQVTATVAPAEAQVLVETTAGPRTGVMTAVATAGASATSAVASAVQITASSTVTQASAAFASALASITAAATDTGGGWEAPVAAAGAVLMFSWAAGRITRDRRTATAASVAADPFNFIQPI